MLSPRRILFERILCPTDLTENSDDALGYAITLARLFGAKLLVCHSVESLSDNFEVEVLRAEEHLKQAVLERRGTRTVNSFKWEKIVSRGVPTSVLLQEATRHHVDLIVMRSGRHTNTTILESTSEYLCRTAPCPILITHFKDRDWISPEHDEVMLKRVLVAYDFSADSELALSYGFSLAQEFQAELHVLHVLPHSPKSEVPELAGLPSIDELAFQKVIVALRSAVPSDASPWCEIRQVVRIGYPYREILNYAEEAQIDLICMGSSGTGFGPKALFGSNSDRVLRQSPCSVLIARPSGSQVGTSH